MRNHALSTSSYRAVSRKMADGRAKCVHYLMRKNVITEIDGFGASGT